MVFLVEFLTFYMNNYVKKEVRYDYVYLKTKHIQAQRTCKSRAPALLACDKQQLAALAEF